MREMAKILSCSFQILVWCFCKIIRLYERMVRIDTIHSALAPMIFDRFVHVIILEHMLSAMLSICESYKCIFSLNEFYYYDCEETNLKYSPFFVIRFSWLPISAILPWCSTIIWSAFRIVLSLCATTITVLYLNAAFRASTIFF